MVEKSLSAAAGGGSPAGRRARCQAGAGGWPATTRALRQRSGKTSGPGKQPLPGLPGSSAGHQQRSYLDRGDFSRFLLSFYRFLLYFHQQQGLSPLYGEVCAVAAAHASASEGKQNQEAGPLLRAAQRPRLRLAALTPIFLQLMTPDQPATRPQPGFAPPLRYAPNVEQVPADEAETIEKIGQMMIGMASKVQQRHGKAMRATHAKATGLLKGELVVAAGLPPELAQGMFARPGRYDVLVRYSQGPSNPVPDRASGQRGMSLKVLGVEGPHVAGSREQTTQDWVLAPDPAFANATASSFLLTFKIGASNTPSMPDEVIVGVSYAARGVEAVLEAVGQENGTLKLLGRPPLHPVSHPYYGQAPVRYGDYIAKVAAFPTAETLAAVGNPHVDTSQDPDAFRSAMVAFFAKQGAAFDLRVQLCTDLEAMPIEDASAEWPEAQSPYRTVAHLTLPPQDAFSDGRFRYFEQRLAFNPIHALQAHHPLGGINRARMAAYLQTQDFRQQQDGVSPAEPGSSAEVPD